LEYLWAVHKNLIQPIVVRVDRSTEGQDWADLMHFASNVRLDPTVLPPPFPLPPPPQAPTENQSALDVIAGDFMLLGMPLNANTCVKFHWRIQKRSNLMVGNNFQK